MEIKVLILLPDGVGLRNFVFSDFSKIASENQLKLKYWNGTTFNLEELNLDSIELNGTASYKTNLLKRARKKIEIGLFANKLKNDIFYSYLFKSENSNLKARLKNYTVKVLSFQYKNNLISLRNSIKKQERKTSYYSNCLNQLKKEQPDIVFCTNQRPVQAISPILAAQDLGIPTATFIFSWDNLPKATMVIETDYYYVWSKFMAEQLVEYYPYINESQIRITGTPQFEVHFESENKLSKSDFCITHNLPEHKRFICFSGDDITTSPHDPEYLSDVCTAIRDLNKRGHHYAIIFRPCPVDFSNRYDDILEKNKDILYLLRPKWEKQGDAWHSALPTQEDQALLYNTVLHSDLIINLGSSMVFDAACHDKPCAYINYNPDIIELKKDVNTVYKYVHFQSMPSKNAVIWLNSKEEIVDKLLEGLNNPKPYVDNAKKWFIIINHQPPQKASVRIVEAIEEIIN